MNRVELEFKILKENVKGAIIAPFEKEITALVRKFGKSGQSGGSAPIVAAVIAKAVEDLCLHKPLYGITCGKGEWIDQSKTSEGKRFWQNNRLTSVFKQGENGKPYYLNAIVFKGQTGSQFTSNGSVKLKDGSALRSRQYIKNLPFKPKTFYVDVIETEWADKTETVKKEGGGWWTSVVKDESQLDEVFEYYERFQTEQNEA